MDALSLPKFHVSSGLHHVGGNDKTLCCPRETNMAELRDLALVLGPPSDEGMRTIDSERSQLLAWPCGCLAEESSTGKLFILCPQHADVID
jgi:hypothetical protein